ncbi:ABC-three component system protein [Desulfitobacterium hafniense]
MNTYIQKVGHPHGKEDIIYSELCMFLDEKVAQMHQQGAAGRSYTISFADFIKVISDAVEKDTARAEFYLKERAYEYVSQSLQGALESICTHTCQLSLADCEILCAAKTAYFLSVNQIQSIIILLICSLTKESPMNII